MNNNRGCLGFIILWLFIIVFTIGNIFYEAFVFMKLYEWFLFNLFNTATISYWQSMGISVVFSFVVSGILFIIELKSGKARNERYTITKLLYTVLSELKQTDYYEIAVSFDDDEDSLTSELLGRAICSTIITSILFGIGALVQLGV